MALSLLYYLPAYNADNDLWFHLRYGEHYVQNRSWHIDHSVFSWTPTVSGWQYVTWLGSSALYLIHSIGNMPGLFILRWAVLFTVVAAFVKLIRASGDKIQAFHVLALLLAGIAWNTLLASFKAELFSVLFFTLTVVAYYLFRMGQRNYLWALPFIHLVWVNTHGGFILGLFFVTLALAVDAVSDCFTRGLETLRSRHAFPGAILGFCYLAVLINPYGPNYHISILRTMLSSEYMGEANQLLAYVNLWSYVLKLGSSRIAYSALAMVAMAACFVILAVYAYWRKKVLDLSIIVTNGVFFLFGMNTSRAILCFPALCVGSLIFMTWKADGRALSNKYVSPISQIAVYTVGLILIHSMMGIASPRGWVGLEANRYVPEREVAFVKEHNLRMPMFNDYDSGGFLMWALYPQYKVFIDPRWGPYVSKVLPDYVRLLRSAGEEQFREFTSKYPFKFAFVSIREFALLGHFFRSAEWKIVYFGAAAAVFVKIADVDPKILESLRSDIGIERFREIRDPLTLMYLFYFCLNYSLDDAERIMGFYREQVSHWYPLRDNDLAQCARIVAQRRYMERMAPQGGMIGKSAK